MHFMFFSLCLISLLVLSNHAFAESNSEETKIIIKTNPDFTDNGEFSRQSGDGVFLGVIIEGVLHDRGLVKVVTTGEFTNFDFETSREETRNFSQGSPKHLFVLDYPFEYDNVYSSTVTHGDFSETVTWIPLSSSGKPVLIEDTSELDSASKKIPPWIKNNVKWWIDGNIDEADFLVGIKYLVSNEIIKVSQIEQKADLKINKEAFIPSKYSPDEIILTGWACDDDDTCYQQHIMCEMQTPDDYYGVDFDILRSYNYGEFEHKMFVDQDWATGNYEITCSHLGDEIGSVEFQVSLEKQIENTAPLVPDWIRNSASWWYDGIVSDNEFLKSIEFLIENDIIIIDGHFDK